MRVLFASAELTPIARVGGLGEAAGGLVAALRRADVDIEVVLPDYGGIELDDEQIVSLTVPPWVGRARSRSGQHREVGPVTLVSVEGMARSHPYVDETGEPWPDNEARFLAFSAAVAALADRRHPDVVHLNDWHTAAATSFLDPSVPTVLTIHTLGYQGVTDAAWLDRLPRDAARFRWYGGTNPLAGGIALAHRVVTVSPNYATEILTPEHGMGMDQLLRERSTAPVGIRNGIDTDAWNPATDPVIAARYDAEDLSGRTRCRRALLAEIGWELDDREPLLGVVSRLVHQKGIDLLAEATRYLPGLPARLVVLGSGEPTLVRELRRVEADQPDRVRFVEGYDAALAHRLFAGVDAIVMPSRFEPCGLAQMQAMRYGAVPVVTAVGGLVDTVTDADSHRRHGTGFVAPTVDTASLVDALHRLVRARHRSGKWSRIQRRGMSIDWSWDTPAAAQIAVYEEVAGS